MIVIVDYGVGNVGSIRNMLKKAGFAAKTSADASEILVAEKLILPGVGAFSYCMQSLRDSGLIEALTQRVIEDECPLLGICVGMQMLAKGSEEGPAEGLGWIDAQVRKFRFDVVKGRRLRVPHMGWNVVEPTRPDELLASAFDERRYYFVHSYYMDCASRENVIGEANYGGRFAAAVRNKNVCGVQFHPEKSHKFGLEILRNYASAE